MPILWKTCRQKVKMTGNRWGERVARPIRASKADKRLIKPMKMKARCSNRTGYMLSNGFRFVIRSKNNLRYVRMRSMANEPGKGVCSDQIISLSIEHSRNNYPEHLRRIRFYDAHNKRYFVFLTNNFVLPAASIASLYKSRWQVELFFKWIKQHLRIKRFYGNSANAVKIQVWIAVCVYVQVAILKKQLHLAPSLHRILRILSTHVFEKVALAELLRESPLQKGNAVFSNQLQLF